jgi:hypothetical protein
MVVSWTYQINPILLRVRRQYSRRLILNSSATVPSYYLLGPFDVYTSNRLSAVEKGSLELHHIRRHQLEYSSIYVRVIRVLECSSTA